MQGFRPLIDGYELLTYLSTGMENRIIKTVPDKYLDIMFGIYYNRSRNTAFVSLVKPMSPWTASLLIFNISQLQINRNYERKIFHWIDMQITLCHIRKRVTIE